MSGEVERPLLAHSQEELAERVVALGGKAFHARIAREALFAGARSYEEMTSLPTQLRRALEAELPLLSSELRLQTHASDGATKLLLGFPARGEGSDEVETVHIPPHNPKSPKGATLCVSTQVGCPVACPFCASGLAGLVRNMEAHEILEQFLRGMEIGPIGRAVVMGIGEPLLNYKEVRAALDVVNQELGLGARNCRMDDAEQVVPVLVAGALFAGDGIGALDDLPVHLLLERVLLHVADEDFVEAPQIQGEGGGESPLGRDGPRLQRGSDLGP